LNASPPLFPSMSVRSVRRCALKKHQVLMGSCAPPQYEQGVRS